MTVNNNAGNYIDYNDIEISDSYTEMEYRNILIKLNVGLRIFQIVIDTVGADAYSVIELKMIEQILSENGV